MQDPGKLTNPFTLGLSKHSYLFFLLPFSRARQIAFGGPYTISCPREAGCTFLFSRL
jgi:hypothetical protein